MQPENNAEMVATGTSTFLLSTKFLIDISYMLFIKRMNISINN